MEVNIGGDLDEARRQQRTDVSLPNPLKYFPSFSCYIPMENRSECEGEKNEGDTLLLSLKGGHLLKTCKVLVFNSSLQY